MKREREILVALAALSVLCGCHHANEPTSPCFVEPPDGTNQSSLYKVRGPGACGTGGTSVTPFSTPEGGFAATVRFVVKGARPNTTYTAQRAAETGRSLGSDGVCQRADGLAPWPAGDTTTPAFVSFPIPWMPGPKKTLTTDAEGSGATEFEHRAPNLPRGTQFDVEMRLVDDEIAPTTELRSACMTVLVQ